MPSEKEIEKLIEEIEENTEKEEPDTSVPVTTVEKKPFWKFWS